MKGHVKIINYDASEDRVNIEITSPYSAKTFKAWFERNLIFAHYGKFPYLKWIDDTIEYYTANEAFRNRLENTFANRTLWRD